MRGAAAVRWGDVSRWAATSAREMDGADPLLSGWSTATGRASSPLDWVPISLVGAVEIYPVLDDVPREFQVAGAECGVILVWTVRK
jgi:hypothetical protein